MSYREGMQIGNAGMNLARTFMMVNEMQGKQEDRQTKQEERKHFETAAGMSVGEYKGRLAASNLVKIAGEKNVEEAKKRFGAMSDADALSYEPRTYADHLVLADRIQDIRTNKDNRAGIEETNKKKATEAYKLSLTAFKESHEKYKSGDSKGAIDGLVKIGQITNNPFIVKPNPDGETLTLYFTKDGVEQPGNILTIPEALKVSTDHLNGEIFFREHLQNRERRRKLNEEAVLDPVTFTKGGKTLRAIKELDLNSNNMRWSVYDENGDLYGGMPIADINELRKEGWKQTTKIEKVWVYNPEKSTKRQVTPQEADMLVSTGKWKRGQSYSDAGALEGRLNKRQELISLRQDKATLKRQISKIKALPELDIYSTQKADLPQLEDELQDLIEREDQLLGKKSEEPENTGESQTEFKTPDEVRSAFNAGTIDQQKALEILKTQFGME